MSKNKHVVGLETDEKLFEQKVDELIELWRTQLPVILEKSKTSLGLLDFIRLRENIKNLSRDTPTDFPSVIFLHQILSGIDENVDFEIKEPARQLAFLIPEKRKELIEFKINHFLSNTKRSKEEKEQMTQTLFETLDKENKLFYTKEEARQVLGKVQIDGPLKEELTKVISQNSLDVALESVHHELGNVASYSSEESKQARDALLESSDPVAIFFKTSASYLEFSTIKIVEANLGVNKKVQDKLNSFNSE